MLIVAYISSVVGVGARVGVGACFFVDVDTPRCWGWWGARRAMVGRGKPSLPCATVAGCCCC